MGEQDLRIPDYYPEVGRAIAITNITSLVERIATVENISSKETWLKLSRPKPMLFKTRDRVRMKHWNEGNIYYWGEEVLSVTSRKGMAISRRTKKATIGRRKSFRLRSEIPLSLTVLNAVESQLSEKVFTSKTQNISEGGLAFETELPLTVGDELQVSLSLTSSQQVSTGAWVVRSKLGNRGVHSIGVEFLELKRSVQPQIQQFLEAGEQTPALSKEERDKLIQQRDSLRKELEFLLTMPKEHSTMAGREGAIKIEIQEINKKLVRDLDNRSSDW